MAAGDLIIGGTTYALKAQATPMRKQRFYSQALDLNGNIVITEYGNTAKRRWSYTGKCDKSVCAALELALDTTVKLSFTDHTGASYTYCVFAFEYNQTGNYNNNCEWILDVQEV